MQFAIPEWSATAPQDADSGKFLPFYIENRIFKDDPFQILDQEGLITPTNNYYIVTQLDMPEPVHPEDWSLTITGEVARPLTLTLADLRKLPGRTVRAVTECAGNDEGFFDYEKRGMPKRKYVSIESS